MKTRLMLAIAIVAASGTLALAGPVQNGYGPGFRWSRMDDYEAGTVNGSAAGTPGRDAEGNPTWHYEHVRGEGFGSANPWYAQSATAMVWDSAWMGDPEYGLWAAEDDAVPAIDRGFLYQSSAKGWIGNWQDSPVVRWVNPTGAPVSVALEGSLVAGWSVNGQMPHDMEVILARDGAQGIDWLYKQTLSRPTDSETLVIPLGGISAEIEAGGSIILSMRPVDAIERPSFVYLDDTAVTIVQISRMPGQSPARPTGDSSTVAVVPEPATMAILALTVAGLGRYVRRRRNAESLSRRCQ